MSEFRQDPLSGRWVIIAPERADRPHDVDQAGGTPRPCPFCAGGELDTPGETLAIRTPGTEPNQPGWRVRVVPNKYPALSLDAAEVADEVALPGSGVHEVILESPRHLRSTTEQSPSEVTEVLQIYRERLRVLHSDPRWRYATIFKNVGAAGGASLEHLHSQLVAMPIVPRAVEETLTSVACYHREHRRCYYCDLIERESHDGRRIVFETDSLVALCPAAARFAYECWLLPKRHAADFTTASDDQLAALAGGLLATLNRLETTLHRPAYNYLLRTAPFDRRNAPHYHWYLEIFPRITTLAGFELSTDFFINIVPPEAAAARLRSV